MNEKGFNSSNNVSLSENNSIFSDNSLFGDSFIKEEEDIDTEDFMDSIIFSDPAVIKALDIDGDGYISNSEKAKFKKYIMGYDGNLADLSQDDIIRAFYDINSRKFSYNNNIQQRAAELDLDTEFNSIYSNDCNEVKGYNTGSTNALTTDYNTNIQIGYGCTSNSYGTYGYLNNMSLEELQNEKTQQAGIVNDARDSINEVYSGENEKVKNANEKYEEAKERYDEALENDENVTKELKEERDKTVQEIESQENVVDTLNTNINNKKCEISDQESVISSDEATISELQSQLSALNSQSSDDPEKQAAIEAQKRQVEAAIQQAQETLNNDKQKLESLKQELSEFESELPEQEEKLQNLQTKKTEIDNEINKTCSDETKKAQESCNIAKNNIKFVKESELRNAQNTLQNEQNKLNAINSKIEEKKVIVADEEWQQVANNNIDLTEKLENGEPRYIIAQGYHDNKYHVYDMSTNKTIVSVASGNNTMYTLNKCDDNTQGKKVCYMDADTAQMCCFNACYYTDSPLSFDMNGDGVKTSDKIISYDIDGDGKLDNIFDSADAVLVFDKDNDGISGEDGSECFGNNTDLDGDNVKDGFNDGFEALKEFAKQNNLINGNDDNVLDEDDIKYLEENFGFKIKLNGYNSEAQSLIEAGITEINLAQTNNTTLIDNFDNKGNQLMQQEGATFKVNGETREYADIWHKLIA